MENNFNGLIIYKTKFLIFRGHNQSDNRCNTLEFSTFRLKRDRQSMGHPDRILVSVCIPQRVRYNLKEKRTTRDWQLLPLFNKCILGAERNALTAINAFVRINYRQGMSFLRDGIDRTHSDCGAAVILRTSIGIYFHYISPMLLSVHIQYGLNRFYKIRF